METGILIFIILDAAFTIFFFWTTLQGYFFLKDVIGWESTEGKICDLMNTPQKSLKYQNPVVQFKTADNRSIQFKAGSIKGSTLSVNDKVQIIYPAYNPYKAIIKSKEDTKYKQGIKGITFLIIFNVIAGILYYFTLYLKY